MKNFKRIISFIVVFAIILSASAFIAYGKAEKTVTLTISAAASLKDAMQEVAKLYKKDKPNVTLTFNFGASGALQKQIEQGAPADLFISAATKQMDALKSEKLLVDNTVKNLLLNEVVLIAPKDSKLDIKGFKDLTGKDLKIIALGEPKSVPAGQYAEEVLKYYKILDPVKKKSVQGKDVRELLTWVEGKNADAAIVYKTDALVSKKVKIIATAPANSHSPVVYPAAVIKSSKNLSASKDFLTYLSGSKAKAVFVKYGFKMAAK